MRINSDLSGLRQEQVAHQAHRPEQPPKPPPTTPASSSSPSDVQAQVASENQAAGRREPLDPAAASATATALRKQIQANPQAAIESHGQLSPARTRDLLS
ncbi:MAG: hypothetical protein KGR26_14625 [Cyanobacteria bacterium REEB65]|nr:hypothetical protein [Cyanobacteria bacterium REEB65]